MLPSLKMLLGFALDLCGTDEAGRSWDFTSAEMRGKAWALLLKEKPLVLIGSTPCTPFCNWQALNADGSHAMASGKVAREATVYRFRLCRAIFRGCAHQFQADRRLQPGQYGVQGLGRRRHWRRWTARSSSPCRRVWL